MDICEYHLLYPDLSQHQVAKNLGIHQKTVWKAYRLLNQSITY